MKLQQLHTLPEGWEMKPLGDLMTLISGQHINSEDYNENRNGIGYLTGPSDFGSFGPVISKWTQKPKIVSEKGDILITVKGSGVGSICPNNCRVAISRQLMAIRPTKTTALFLLHHLLKQHKRISEAATGSTVPGLSRNDISSITIPLPPLPEQRRIAAVLGTWDRAIEQITDLLKQLRTRHRGLMQRLLTGKVRLPGFDGEWCAVNANEVFRNVSIRNHPNEPLLSATQEHGVIPRLMLDGRVTMPEGETGGYKLVVPGDFIISLRSFQGGIETSDYRGVVSPAYTVLKPKVVIDDNFYRHYFKSIRFIRQLGVAIIGIRDGKQISFEDFSAIRIPKPELDEQRAIASILDASLREIRQQEAKLAALREQKRGLMQCLLTGQVRVPDSVSAQEAV